MEGRGEVRRAEEGFVKETTQVDAVERWGGGEVNVDKGGFN